MYLVIQKYLHSYLKISSHGASGIPLEHVVMMKGLGRGYEIGKRKVCYNIINKEA